MNLRERLSASCSTIKRLTPNLDYWLFLILVITGLLWFYRLDDPDSFIFDETYYVQAARVIDGQPVQPEGLPSDWFSQGDPNREHPPLAKVIIAAGLHFIQAPGVSWRVPSIAFGYLSLLSVYAIVRRLSNRSAARWSVALLASENLFFVHSRIATLDIYVVGLTLAAIALYLYRRPEFAALTLGLATACKINGMFTLGAIICYEVIDWATHRRSADAFKFRFKPLLALTAFYVPFFLLILGSLDNQWTEFRNPFEHVKHILTYGTNLSREEGVGPQGIESTPLQWWVGEKSFDYFILQLNKGSNSATPIRFRGIISPFLLAATPFALVYCFQKALRGDRLAILGILLISCNYFPFLASWVKYRRICYIYYMVPILPGMTISIARLLQDCPRWVSLVFLAAQAYAFALYFPFHGSS